MTSGAQPDPEVPTPEDILRNALGELQRRARILGRVAKRELKPFMPNADETSGKAGDGADGADARQDPPKLDDRGPQGR